jgi:hypothetical protein
MIASSRRLAPSTGRDWVVKKALLRKSRTHATNIERFLDERVEPKPKAPAMKRRKKVGRKKA